MSMTERQDLVGLHFFYPKFTLKPLSWVIYGLVSKSQLICKELVISSDDISLNLSVAVLQKRKVSPGLAFPLLIICFLFGPPLLCLLSTHRYTSGPPAHLSPPARRASSPCPPSLYGHRMTNTCPRPTPASPDSTCHSTLPNRSSNRNSC